MASCIIPLCLNFDLGDGGLQVLAAASELAIPHYVSATIFAVTKANSKDLFAKNIRWLAVMAFSYGTFAGLRGFCFSLLNTDLIQRLRYTPPVHSSLQ